jgi:hypothetical protein
VARQLMCKILVKVCAAKAYKLDDQRAMIHWNQSDWEKLMEYLGELFQTSTPFEDKHLQELYFACYKNMLLADHRRILEDDIKHKDERRTVSLSTEDQKHFQYVVILCLKRFSIDAFFFVSLFRCRTRVMDLLDALPNRPSNIIGEKMTDLHEVSGDYDDDDDNRVLTFLSPADLAHHLCKKPFLLDWVIEKIEEVVGDCNNRKFNGQEAVLFKLGYEMPSRFETADKKTDEQVHQGTPKMTHSPASRQINRSQHPTPKSKSATPSSSNDSFLQQHKPVVLGSVLGSVLGNIHFAAPKSPSNSFRKRKNPEYFDRDGRARFRRKWTPEQDQAIFAGLKKFGTMPNKWSLILNEYPRMFEGRTSVMIKDRFRTLKRTGEIPESVLIEIGELRVEDTEV